MSDAAPDEPTVAELTRWLDRERRARRSAEEIAEHTTGQLYAATQDLAVANGALQSFLATTSHDLRSPLAAIMGGVALLETRHDELSPTQRNDLLGGMRRSGDRLERLVDDLFTMSRIQAGQVDPRIEPVDVGVAVAQLCESLPRRGEELAVGRLAGLAVLVDPDHLQRILVNYVSNAIKYGEAPVALDGFVVDGGVELRVSDRGPGVPEAFREHLFEHFARAEDTSGIDGTGLGLAIVRGLARANGGDAWYEPAEPRGSCFVARIPTAA